MLNFFIHVTIVEVCPSLPQGKLAKYDAMKNCCWLNNKNVRQLYMKWAKLIFKCIFLMGIFSCSNGQEKPIVYPLMKEADTNAILFVYTTE
jgi:hypothetical protein